MECAISIIVIKEPGNNTGSFLKKPFRAVLIGLISIFSFKSFGQDSGVTIVPTAGITWRSTAMNFFNFKAVIPYDPTNPYHYEKNVQGFSLNPGLQFKAKSVGIEYFSNLRYDVVHYILGSNNQYKKEFIIDHNFNLILKKKFDFGFGLTIVNAGKGYRFVNPIPRYHHIEFKTYNFFVTLPIKKVMNLEIKALYVPKNFPENPKERYMMYSLRAYYTFKFKK
jgi:hypothetical protein